jgi:hypothetical protein
MEILMKKSKRERERERDKTAGRGWVIQTPRVLSDQSIALAPVWIKGLVS